MQSQIINAKLKNDSTLTLISGEVDTELDISVIIYYLNTFSPVIQIINHKYDFIDDKVRDIILNSYGLTSIDDSASIATEITKDFYKKVLAPVTPSQLFSTTYWVCPVCGSLVNNKKTCPVCGSSPTPAPVVASPPAPVVALLPPTLPPLVPPARALPPPVSVASEWKCKWDFCGAMNDNTKKMCKICGALKPGMGY